MDQSQSEKLQKEHNFHALEEVRNCRNCEFSTWTMTDQGMYKCLKLQFEAYITQTKYVCDLHEFPKPPTPQEIALAKLTKEDKKALGL